MHVKCPSCCALCHGDKNGDHVDLSNTKYDDDFERHVLDGLFFRIVRSKIAQEEMLAIYDTLASFLFQNSEK